MRWSRHSLQDQSGGSLDAVGDARVGVVAHPGAHERPGVDHLERLEHPGFRLAEGVGEAAADLQSDADAELRDLGVVPEEGPGDGGRELGLVGEQERAGFLDDAIALVANYYTMEDPTRFEPESCELRIEAELPDGVRLRGFVDRIDIAPTGQMRVVDYKTGKLPRERYQAQALFQMKFYALLIYRTRGVIPDQLRLMYLADARDLIMVPREDELLRFEATLSALWQTILEAGATGDFRPSPSRLCDWCDHQQRCPSFGGTPPPYPGWPG